MEGREDGKGVHRQGRSGVGSRGEVDYSKEKDRRTKEQWQDY